MKIIYMKNVIFFLIVLLFTFRFLCSNCFSQTGWVNQPLPINANSYDMKFFDANTGIISLETPALLRTTNGGQNWIVFNNYMRANNFDKINDSTLFAVVWIPTSIILRTFNKGATWDSIQSPSGFEIAGLSFVNNDTGWVTAFDGNVWKILKTTNGGYTFQTQATNIGSGQIFFLKYKINGEYYGWVSHYNSMYKTTNSGVNWFLVGPAGNLTQLNMLDTSTGWASNGSVNILKTTNGGLNWINLPMPTGNNILLSNINRFKIVNSNKIYGVGGNRWFGGSKISGIIWITTNSGLNWGFQQPDTSFPYVAYDAIDFIDSTKGWCNNLHTTDGGGQITKIKIENGIIPKQYELKQNYPNPFNPSTAIEFSIKTSSNITLRIFDITGKEVVKIYNEELLSAGTYKAILDFGKFHLSSGVYFYKIEVNDINNNKVFIETKKMIYTK